MKKRKFKGFTLIEILVVIAIIAILATIVIINVANSRDKARDASRKANLETVNKAVVMHQVDNGSYPKSYSNDGNCAAANGSLEKLKSSSCAGSTLIADGKVSSIPIDPVFTGDDAYMKYVSDGSTYKIETKLSSSSSSPYFQASPSGLTEAGSSIVPCPGDINGDRVVDNADRLVMQSCWYKTVAQYPECASSDLDHNGEIGIPDYSFLMTYMGQTCP